MYNVIESEKTIDKIDDFTKGYLDGFLNLFYDSGIENLYLIEDNYKKIAVDLKIKVLNSIEEYLSRDIIGKKVLTNNEYLAITLVGNFRLFIKYSENKKKKIRFIENIEFHKK